MTQQEYENKIKELQDELEQLKAAKIEVEQPKRWKPNTVGVYWLIKNSGDVGAVTWDNGTYDEWCYLIGNCFKTEEEAEEYKKQIEYTARYKNYIEDHSEPLDWDIGFQWKYYAIVNCITGEIDIDESNKWKRQGAIYASSKEIIKAAIKEIGEDNFKKYVLGVK